MPLPIMISQSTYQQANPDDIMGVSVIISTYHTFGKPLDLGWYIDEEYQQMLLCPDVATLDDATQKWLDAPLTDYNYISVIIQDPHKDGANSCIHIICLEDGQHTFNQDYS